MSSAEQEARCPVANEFFEKSGNRRVDVNLAKAICCFESLFNPTVMNFLLDKDGEEVRRNVLVNLDAKRLADSIVRPGPKGTGCNVGDYNGDGIADLACYDKNTGWSVGLGTGDGFDISPWGTDPNPTHLGGGSCIFGDFDGDGRTDVACYVVEYSGRNIVRQYWRVGVSTGRSFAASDWATPVGFHYVGTEVDRCFDGDFVGTGKTGLVCDADNGYWSVIIPDGPAPDLLRSITDTKGAALSATYKSTATEYPSPHLALPFPVNVVTSLQTGDGRGTFSTKSFSYSGGLYDIAGREFRGFSEVNTVDPVQSGPDQLRTRYSFHQGIEPPIPNNDYVGLVGKPSRIQSMDTNGRLLLDQTFAYRENGGKAPYFNPPAQIDNYTCDGATCGKHSILKMEYEPSYGNLIREERVADVIDHSQDVLVLREFLHDDNDWIVGLPVKETVSHPIGSTSEMVASVQYGYDDHVDCEQSQRSSGHAQGNLTSVRRWSENAAYSEWLLSYDSFGNNTCQRDPNGGVLHIAYDNTFHSLPTAFTNPLNQPPVTLRYFGVDGVPADLGLMGELKDLTDANQGVSTLEYDAFGRPLTLTSADFRKTEWSYNDLGNPNQQNVRVRATSGLVTSTYFDGLGRTWRTKTSGPDDEVIVRDTAYSQRGAVSLSSAPYFEGKDTPAWTKFTYDPLLRSTKTERPDATFATRCYGEWKSLNVDENGHIALLSHDGYGRLAKVEKYPGTFDDCKNVPASALSQPYAATTYRYNALGTPSTIVDANGNETRLKYDGRGLVTRREDPDSGTWTYAYDPNGNLSSRTDAEEHAVYLHYDAINRLIQKDYLNKQPLGSGEFVLEYDKGVNGIGRLDEVRSHRSESHFSYDIMGRIVQSTRIIGQNKLSLSIGYDAGSRLASLVYPSGREVTYGYNGPVLSSVRLGNALELRKADFDAFGRARLVTFPVGVIGRYTFDRKNNPACARDDFRLCSITFDDETGRLLRKFLYAYDSKGNVKSVGEDDSRKLVAEYDDYDRLLSVSLADHSVSPYPVSYKYDPLGNMTFNSRLGVYRYGAAGSHPHATTVAGKDHFEYDRDGNVSRSGLRAFTFNAEGRPTKVVLRRRFGGWFSFVFPKKVTSTFVYGWNGAREMKKETRMLPYPLPWFWPKKTTLFVNELSECRGNKCDDYVFSNDSLVATMRAHKGHVAFAQTDFLRSSRLVTDRQEKSSVTMDYLPFGDLLSKLGHDRDDVAQRFTGASFDKSAGLYYFNFRFYDSELGRFVSPDPFKGVLENPEELNRYSYVANNPLTLIDPMGLSDVDPNQVDPPPDVTFKDVAKDPITTFRMKVTIPDKKAPPTDGNDETDDSGASNKQTDEKLKSGADRQWVGLVGINWVGGVGSARVSNTISGGIACCKSFTFMGPFFTEAHSDESAANLVYAGASIAPVVIVGYGQPSGYLGQSTYGSVAWGAGPLAVAPVSGYEKSTNKSLTTVGLSLRGIGYEFGASAGVSNTVTVRSVVEGAIMDFLVGVDNALWGYATGPFSTIGRPINRY